MRKNILYKLSISIYVYIKNNNVCFGDLVEKPFHEISNLQNERKNRKNKIDSGAPFSPGCYALHNIIVKILVINYLTLTFFL